MVNLLQAQNRYCSNRANFQYKSTAQCTSTDLTGVIRPIFSDRICDGLQDCPGSEDELGGIETCIQAQEKLKKQCNVESHLREKRLKVCVQN